MVVSRNTLSNDLLSRVGDFVAARMIPDEPLALGLSGGCDSVVLLHLLSRLNLGSRLSAVHVHHGLSPNADYWADFCSTLCIELGVELRIIYVGVDRKSGLGLEAAARAARYSAFSSSGQSTFFLAHHQGDQAETLLFNLLRGSGVAGAAAMAEQRQHGPIRILRPLLNTSRSVLESYASGHLLSWIDDESNADTSLTRNFLRHQVLKTIDQRFPAAERSLAQAARHFSEANDLLDELALSDWQMASENGTLDLARLRTLSPARIKNLLRFRLRQIAWQAPAASRLDEFVRQLISAGADRHPELKLAAGSMRAGKGRLAWVTQN